MVNKGGWIRIVEASIAILLIASAIFVIYRVQSERKEIDLTYVTAPILEEMGKNIILRERILMYNTNTENGESDMGNENILRELRDFIDKRLKKSYFKYNITICEPSSVEGCALTSYPRNTYSGVYTDERIISAIVTSDDEFNPKKVKIYLWIEG